MRVTDTRLTREERGLLASMVCRELELFRCDDFHRIPRSYQAVGLDVGDGAYLIENEERPVEYFGAPEDVACLSVSEVPALPERPRTSLRGLAEHPVGATIEDVLLVEDVETHSEGSVDLSSYAYTEAVAFALPGEQLVFEKDIRFSEEIFIHRGPDALGEVDPPGYYIDEADADRFRASRSVVSLAGLRPQAPAATQGHHPTGGGK